MTQQANTKAGPIKPLTHQQRRFVDAFTGNASETARKVGMNPDYGRTLMAKPHVVAAILARDAEKPAQEVADRRARQVWWTQVMRDETVPVALRLRASELLGRSEGDFLERHAIEGGPGVVFNLNLAGEKPGNGSEAV